MKNNQNILQATEKQIEMYKAMKNEIKNLLAAKCLDHANLVFQNICDLSTSYDWNNQEFTDPVTGKKGVKDILDNILVPANYDGFTYLGNYIDYINDGSHKPVITIKDGLCGTVAADGSGKGIIEFRFNQIQYMTYVPFYWARWDNNTERFGIITYSGEVFCPNILTKIYEPWNNFVAIESGDKVGGFDLCSNYIALPECRLKYQVQGGHAKIAKICF